MPKPASPLVRNPHMVDVHALGHPDSPPPATKWVQPAPGQAGDEALAAELIAFARANLSHVKAPRRIDFMAELPRHPTGKLYKRLIRDAYWGKESRIV